MSESSTGYILGFDIYTAYPPTSVVQQSWPLDPNCTTTTKLVLGLLEKFQLLDKGHHIYMDNYYTSPELFEELYFRQTYACGNCQTQEGHTIKYCQQKCPTSSICICLKWSYALFEMERCQNKKLKETSYCIVHYSWCWRISDEKKRIRMVTEFQNPK